MRLPKALIVAVGVLAPLGAAWSASAQMPAMQLDPFTGDIRGLALGLHADAMPSGFVKFACGSNGLVPLQKINGFADFAQCRKEEHGLHEVAVEYDNTGKHLADLFVEMYKDIEGGDLWTQQYTGTKMSGHPVILSVLFDDSGVVKGMRAVTDSRARTDQRQVSNMLAVVIRNHYDPQNWTCEKLPLTGGETPIGNSFIKERCETVYRNESRMIVWRNLFRKAGQTGATATGQVAEGDFESSTRWERWALDVKVN